MINKLILSVASCIIFSTATAFAIETAPRISDREIIEGLADLKATQNTILQRFGLNDERFGQVDKRFDQVDKQFDQVNNRFEQVDKRFEQVDMRFEQMDKRFEQVDKRFEQIDKRFEQVDKRFEQVERRFELVDKRFDEMNATNRMFFGFVMSTLLALFGYIVWDRRTLMKPLEERIFSLERELDVGGTEGTKVSRLVKTLRELSKKDDEVARVLKHFHLL